MDQDQLIESESESESETVNKVLGRISAPEAPANALTMALSPRVTSDEPSLLLFGYYNIDVEIAGHYGSILPGAAYIVLLERSTGSVYIRDLSNDDDVPAIYSLSAEPSVTRADGAPATGVISESGHFIVNLTHHLGLPAEPGIYDGFLWLENILSNMDSVEKPAEDAPIIDGADQIAYVASTTLVQVAFTGQELTLRLRARVKEGPVSIIAMAPVSRRIGFITFASGNDSSALVSDIIPNMKSGERVLAVAISNGARSSLIDTATRH